MTWKGTERNGRIDVPLKNERVYVLNALAVLLKCMCPHRVTCAIGSINSLYFHIIGDGKINPSP